MTDGNREGYGNCNRLELIAEAAAAAGDCFDAFVLEDFFVKGFRGRLVLSV